MHLTRNHCNVSIHNLSRHIKLRHNSFVCEHILYICVLKAETKNRTLWNVIFGFFVSYTLTETITLSLESTVSETFLFALLSI